MDDKTKAKLFDFVWSTALAAIGFWIGAKIADVIMGALK